MTNLLKMAPRADCRRCDLWMERLGRCRIIAIAEPYTHPEGSPYRSLQAGKWVTSGPPRSWFDIITTPPAGEPDPEAWTDDTFKRGGQGHAAASAYLTGEEPTCAERQDIRSIPVSHPPEPETDYSDVIGSPFDDADFLDDTGKVTR
jgi:hypothetical protein